MTGPDLIRLAEDLAQCGGIHRLTNCITAACHVFAEHERRAAEECGVGMSDKAVRVNLDAVARFEAAHGGASGAPAGAEASGGILRRVDARGALAGTPDGLASILTNSATNCAQSVNPAPVMPERGERQPVPLRTGNALADEHPRGITHGPGSPIVAEHSGPSDRRVPRFDGKRINPELTDGDGA